MVANTTCKSINSLTIVSVVSIVAITLICLASLGFNSKISIEKEKIEVTATNSNLKNN